MAGEWGDGDPVEDDGWRPDSGQPVGVSADDAAAPPEVDVDYSRTECPDTLWQRRYFHQCNFSQADLSALRTVQCTFIQCNFTAANLDRSQHRLSAFRQCSFLGAQLTDAVFEECQLDGSAFDAAQMPGVIFRGGDLSEASLAGALAPPG